VPVGSALLGLPEHLAPAWRPRIETIPAHRYRIDVSMGWDVFREGLSKRQRKDLRYKVNELERAAGRRLSLHRSTGAEVKEALDLFIDLHLRRWHARGKPGLLPGEDRFYRGLASAGAPIVAFELMAGERLVASQFGLADRQRYAPFNFAFDPAFAEQSPSHVLMQMVIRECCEMRLRSIDMVPRPMAQHWRPKPMEMRHLILSRPAPQARLVVALTEGLEATIRSAQVNPLGKRLRSEAAALAALVHERRHGD
jgi:CelD/BcsL family acetyltransferase involved in cellulose biosynthesis